MFGLAQKMFKALIVLAWIKERYQRRGTYFGDISAGVDSPAIAILCMPVSGAGNADDGCDLCRSDRARDIGARSMANLLLARHVNLQ